MTTDPPPDEVFGFAADDDPQPPPRPAPPLGSTSYDPPPGDEIDLSDTDRPARPRVDILERPIPEDRAPPYQGALIVLAAGLALCLVEIIILAFQKGAGTGAVIALMAVGGLTVQVLVTSGLLAVVGSFCGIDYGPAGEAVLKLAAVNVVVSGFGGGAALFASGGAYWAVPCGCGAGLVAGFALFQWLFRLTMSEVLLTLFGVAAASFLLNAGLANILRLGK